MFMVNQLVGFGAGGEAVYTVPYSVTITGGDYLIRTPGSAGTKTTFTISLWIKRLSTGAEVIISAGTTNVDAVDFSGADKLHTTIASDKQQTTTATYTDTSNWHHIVFAVDTTSGTAGDRARLYYDGVEVTAFDSESNPGLNDVDNFMSNVRHAIGVDTFNLTSSPLDARVAEVHIVDGYQLTAASFGATVGAAWKPKAFIGPWGTQGSYLKFANSASLGADSSGNGNDWTVSGLVAGDQSIDTPSPA